MVQEKEKNETIDLSGSLDDSGTIFRTEGQCFKSASDNARIVQFMIKYSGGLISSPKQAYFILLIFVIIVFSLTIFLLIKQFYSPSVLPPELQEIPAGIGDPQYVPH